MIVQGGAVERARALDLGADDVISFPFEAVEFAARIRAQFRERKPQEELKTMLKYAVQREHFADIVLQLLSRPLGKRRFWLPPVILVLSTAAALVAIDLGISSRGTRKETRQLRAEIARLSTGLGQQGELLRRAEFTRGSLEVQSPSASATRNSLKKQSEDLRRKVASAGGADADSLKRKLADTHHRLKLPEVEGRIARTAHHN